MTDQLKAAIRSALVYRPGYENHASMRKQRIAANVAADRMVEKNVKALEQAGFIQSEGRWEAPDFWNDGQTKEPNPGEPIFVFRQAYQIGNPLHPGFGTDAWIEETLFTTQPWSNYACNFKSLGAVTHWMYVPAQMKPPVDEPDWLAIDLLGAKFGEFYCHWSEITNAPVSALMPKEEFIRYVMDECSNDPRATVEMEDWLNYIDIHGTSNATLGDVLATNCAGPNGSHLTFSELLTQHTI